MEPGLPVHSWVSQTSSLDMQPICSCFRYSAKPAGGRTGGAGVQRAQQDAARLNSTISAMVGG